MSVIVKQIVKGRIDIQALKTVFEMAGQRVQAPGLVTVHNSASGTHQIPVSLHIPPEVLIALGLRQGRRTEYGLGLHEFENGEVEAVYDAFYASPDMRGFVPKLGNLSKVAGLKGSPVNMLYDRQEDKLLVQVAAAGTKPGSNAFMPPSHGKA